MTESARADSRTHGPRAAAVLVLAAAVYFAVRKLVEGDPETATRNASRLLRFEGTLGIDIEHSVQDFVLNHPLLTDVCNNIYVGLHWPFLIFTFVVLFARDQRAFQRLRDTFIVSGAVGLVIFAMFPVAPPRFMPGFVGTVSQAERQHFLPYHASWSNRVASLPSFHVGWTLTAAIVLASTLRSPVLKFIALLPGPLVAIAVIATGNHYVIDVIVGSGLALGALKIVSRGPAAKFVPAEPRAQLAFLHPHARLRR
jgi:membrane-associated phospholipid phosphatase